MTAYQAPPAKPTQPCYTLVRFSGAPANLTGITQVITAGHAQQVVAAWQSDYPDEETVVFDVKNHAVDAKLLATLALSDPAGSARVPHRRTD